jgi:NAD(P)-dependent dehydrogenase (short-subunit alcohol dehydrogenase family)
MMRELDGKNAFVTGGANGIGYAIAERLARAGVGVAVADIDRKAATLACEKIEKAGGRAVPIGCDVTDEASLAAAADEAGECLGAIQILVNNAGAFTVGPLESTARRDWEWLFDINVHGVVNGLRTFLPRMREKTRAPGEFAHIVNTASVSGHIPVAGLSIYTATKFAVVGLSECLRLELAGSSIGVSVLCPGIVRTGLLQSSLEHRAEKYGGSGSASDHPIGAVIEGGTDPADVGERVVAAIQAGDFYILTHPNVRKAFANRFDEILAAYSAHSI